MFNPTPRNRKLLYATGGLCWLFAGAALAWGLTRQPGNNVSSTTAPPSSSKPVDQAERQTADDQTPTLAWAQRAANLRWQRPLHDPPPPPEVPPPSPPPLRVQLVGTIMDANQPQAMLQLSNGQIILASINETHENARLLSIQPDHVTVEYHGQTLTLERQ